jgi:hypothetical protein
MTQMFTNTNSSIQISFFNCASVATPFLPKDLDYKHHSYKSSLHLINFNSNILPLQRERKTAIFF